MRIGVPKETKTLEGRVALVPPAAGDLVKRGHEVWLEKDAGIKSGFKDSDYTRLGVKIAPDAASLTGDPAKLHDVVRNLVENAVNYSPEGADVRWCW